LEQTVLIPKNKGGKKPPKPLKAYKIAFFRKEDKRIVERIEEIAGREHLKPTTLLKKWILEKLEEYEAKEAGA